MDGSLNRAPDALDEGLWKRFAYPDHRLDFVSTARRDAQVGALERRPVGPARTAQAL